jgi:hypothetical protein
MPHRKGTLGAVQRRKSLEGKRSFELVHANICGPMRTISIFGARFFLLFVDDFTRKMWVHFLKQKLDVFIEFKIFKVTVKKELGRTIKIL